MQFQDKFESQKKSDGQRVASVIAFLSRNFESTISVEEAADFLEITCDHFQKIFKRFTGVRADKFIQNLNLNWVKEGDFGGIDGADISHGISHSRSGCLQELVLNHYMMTLEEWAVGDIGEDLVYGWHMSPFGDCLIVAGGRGVCGLAFELDEGKDATINELYSSLGEAKRREDKSSTKNLAEMVFDGGNLDIVLRGTEFQLNVWEGLLGIPSGTVMSYGALAERLGSPRAVRAVARAVARNPVSWLVPCHRILRSNGTISGYRWGRTKKRSMIAVEAAASVKAIYF